MTDRIEVSLSRQDRELLKRIAHSLEALSSDKSDGATAAIKRFMERAPYWGDEPEAKPVSAPYDLWSAERGSPETD